MLHDEAPLNAEENEPLAQLGKWFGYDIFHSDQHTCQVGG